MLTYYRSDNGSGAGDYPDRYTPSMVLSGKWLRVAGFETGQAVRVRVGAGCITLAADS
ncbi:SymE family type I addiction module toxin [Pantoea ananatis]|uniref:SymE family type I addiction module toxin n=1 Tax=Pantoea ananas TaxID=553 RepID=UPI00355B1B67